MRSRVWAISMVQMTALACLIGAGVSGCSRSEPAPRDFTLSDQRTVKAKGSGTTLEQAEEACKQETKQKGIGSILGIMSRLRKGSVDEDYIACMRARGYEVKS
jgi:hypothetical protein